MITHPKVIVTEEHEENDYEVKYKLDEKYTNIPTEYVNQTIDFLRQKRRFSSNSSAVSSVASSQYRPRSDSQIAVDNMLYWLVNPQNYEEVVHSSKADVDVQNTLTMLSATYMDRRKSSLKPFGDTRKPRRISWPDEEKEKDDATMENNKTLKKLFKRSNSHLEVILEYDV